MLSRVSRNQSHAGGRIVHFDEILFFSEIERVMNDDIFEIQRNYPLVFHACHVDHVRARNNPAKISPRDSTVLAHLDLELAMTPIQLAAHLGVVPSSISASLKRLESLGYVKSTVSARDHRSVEIRLTRTGAEALRTASVLDTKRLGAVLRLLTKPERAAARLGLTLLAKAAREWMLLHPGERRQRQNSNN